MPLYQEIAVDLQSDDCRRKTNISCQQHESLSRHDVVIFSFITGLKPTFLHSSNHTGHSHAQNTTALQPNVYLTGITAVIGQKEGKGPFGQCTPLPSETADFRVSI
jgi:hypothetical protein